MAKKKKKTVKKKAKKTVIKSKGKKVKSPKIKSNKKPFQQPWSLDKGDRDKYYGLILGREHIFKGQHRLYVTSFQKGDEKSIHIDKGGPIPGGNGYYSQHFTLRKARHWNGLVRAVDKLAVITGWSTSKEEGSLGEIISNIEVSSKKPAEVKKAKELAARRLRANKKLRKELEDQKNKLYDFMGLYRKTHLPAYRDSLKKFKKLINEKHTERHYQKFLADQKNTWILGFEYVAVNRHDRAGTSGFPDFVPERFDGFCDVIEFKRPSHPVFIWKEGHWRQSAKLKDGISQLMDYLELFDRNPRGSDDLMAKADKYRANGVLVIGNLRGDSNRDKQIEALRKHNSFLQRIKITTYDGLLDQAKAVIDRLEKE